MDTNFLDSVLSTAGASEFQENLAKAKDQALAGAQEAKGQAYEGISGGILAGAGIIGKGTGLTKVVEESSQQLTKAIGNKINAYTGDAYNALKTKVGNVADNAINTVRSRATNMASDALDSVSNEASNIAQRAQGALQSRFATPQSYNVQDEIMNSDPEGAVSGLTDTAEAEASNSAQGFIGGAVQRAQNAIQSRLATPQSYNVQGQIMDSDPEGNVSGLTGEASDAVSSAGNSISGALSSAGDAVRGAVSSAGNTISGAVSGASDTVSGVVSSAGSTAGDLAGSLAGAGVADEVGAGLASTGILAPLGGLLVLGATLGTAIEGIKDLFEAHSHHTAPDFSGIPQPQMNFGVY